MAAVPPPPPPPPPPLPRRRILKVLAVAIAAALLWPTALPSPWTFHLRAVPLSAERVARLPKFPAALTGPYAPNSRLQSAVRLFEGQVSGSESVALGTDHVHHLGQLAMLDRSGRLLVVKMSTAMPLRYEELKSTLEPAREIGLVGRPLGFTYDGDGRLVVCDSTAGLVRYDPKTRSTEILSNAVSGSGLRLNYINDVDIGPDGAIYFSSSTDGLVGFGKAGFFDTNRAALLNLFEGRPTGRLLRYKDGRTTVLLDGLFYANGVAVAADGSFVLVVETFGARVHKYWLTGERAGSSEIFVDNLPGFPDGISAAVGGGWWVALVARPSPLVLFPFGYAWVRTLLAHVWAAGWLEALIKPWGCVVRLAADGAPQYTLMDPTGERVRSVSAVEQNGHELYLGNLHGNHVSVLKLTDDEL